MKFENPNFDTIHTEEQIWNFEFNDVIPCNRSNNHINRHEINKKKQPIQPIININPTNFGNLRKGPNSPLEENPKIGEETQEIR